MNRTLRLLLPLLVLTGGIAAAVGLFVTKKKPQRSMPSALPPRVEFVEVRSDSPAAAIDALGTVIPARALVVQPEVGGRVVFVHPDLAPGGVIRKGKVLLRIERADYALGLEERKAARARAAFELALEEGRGRVAAREWKLVGSKDVSGGEAGRALALRQPHLANAKAALEGAEAGVRRAQLAVDRTVIRAPFDLLVREESVEVGQIVGPQTRVAQVVGTESFWVQVSVPVSSLRWIREASTGNPSSAQVRLGLGSAVFTERSGSVLRVTGELDAKGQMAQVIVEVRDPLGLGEGGQEKLLLGAFVRVHIEGRALDAVFEIPRIALRNGKEIWVIDKEDKLQIRGVESVWSNQQSVFLGEGLEDGDRVVVSRLSAPVEGMALRTADGAEARPSGALGAR